jgi:hypothetical protein
MNQEIVSTVRDQLIRMVKKGLRESDPHSIAFALRLLDEEDTYEINYQSTLEILSGEAAYEGYPQVSSLGYLLGGNRLSSDDSKDNFLAGISRLMNRSEKGIETFSVDDVAVLGIADGLRKIQEAKYKESVEAARKWLLDILSRPLKMKIWSSRMRDLAGDLLDHRGRLRTSPDFNDVYAQSLELALRSIWQEQYEFIPLPSKDCYVQLLRDMLSTSLTLSSELEKSTICLKALDLLIYQVAETLLSKPDEEPVKSLGIIKNRLDQKAQRQAKKILWASLGLLVLVNVTLVILIYFCTWNVMEPWTYIIDSFFILGAYFYFVITLKEFSPLVFYNVILAKRKQKLYEESGFDLRQYEVIVNQEISE